MDIIYTSENGIVMMQESELERIQTLLGYRTCDACGGDGFLFVIDDNGHDDIQACDRCNKYKSDKDVYDNARFTMKKSEFLAHYFSDFERVQDLGYRAMFAIKKHGSFTITTEDILKEYGDVPARLVEESQGVGYDLFISNEKIDLI